MEKEIKKTSEILLNIIESIEDRDVSIAFSGGLDSSLLAFLVKKYSSNVENIELIYTGKKDTTDYYNSKRSAKTLGLDLTRYILTEKEILDAKDEIWEIINSQDLIEASYLLPYYIALKKMKYETMITGYGADALFMGFNKFVTNREEALEISRQNYKELCKIASKREYLLAERLNKKLILPFINKDLENFVLPLSIDYKIEKDGTRVKILLRETAKYLGLKEEIAEKPKKSAQYGSGVWKVLKKNEK